MRKYGLIILFLCSLGLQAAETESPRVRLVRENSPAVVAVNVLKTDGSTFTGTGFVLTPDGLIATNRHVIDDAVYTNLTFSDGTVSAEAKHVASAANVDLALLQIPAKHLHTVHITSSANVRPGQGITVIGNPRRLQNTVSTGIISQIRQKADGTIWHQISAPISPSSSGSPVFDRDGNVISIAFASYAGENNQNLNFASPSDYLVDLIRSTGNSLSCLQTASNKDEELSANPVVRHIQRAWAILKRLFTTK